MEDAGFSMIEIPVQPEIKIYMRKAVQHFANNGLITNKVITQIIGAMAELFLYTLCCI